ncbi:TIGR02452 family protein [Allostreptomyces psammosilenae]|uniref:Uncharacterized protein (TIGR02452 family) n=1 Tax=Allostreptomyces psammosilenae TaxID=1892865 RepID=A0A853A8S9_9ACTN|nr:TIGR02452 family protein [Allostreptomyces psammosilenae]NYI06832.1 uncharacterized protein (TIGR02452 family) [Allostreptomyces psammosilenae]
MSSRLRQIAAENERIAAEGHYVVPGTGTVSIRHALDAARAGTRSYAPDQLDALLATVTGTPAGAATGTVEVTGEDSLRAARRLDASGARNIAVLNFASARNPGGGYVNGAKAQEEDVCRGALLHPCLLRAPDYYEAHRAVRDPFYSHRVIHSPRVPVHRAADGTLLAQPPLVSFLTWPAPNAGVIARQLPERVHEVPDVLRQRAARVLAVAAHHGARQLVLGAWGCGVFRNDPRQVAAAFAEHLGPGSGGAFEGRFEHVVFAVLDRSAGQPTLAAFQRAFAA